MSGRVFVEDSKDATFPTMLFSPLELPCGVLLKNRIVKSAMSDSLGDGAGFPTDEQACLYRRWAEGGSGLSLVGEIQFDPYGLEAPGNLLLSMGEGDRVFRSFTTAASEGMHLWAQIGHAGALAYQPVGRAIGPSAIDISGLSCVEMSAQEIILLPERFARAAARAKGLGFSGVEIHAAHGFLLSQFLSPLFNRRSDVWGGSALNRARVLLETIDATRARVGSDYPVAVKLNGSDLAEGGLTPVDAIKVIKFLRGSEVDLLDVSAGTYFPGAVAASEGSGGKEWLLDLTLEARRLLDAPVTAAAGFRDRRAADEAISFGRMDLVSLARPLALHPDLPNRWREGAYAVTLPRFDPSAQGGITAWYTLQLQHLVGGTGTCLELTPDAALAAVAARDKAREVRWRERQAANPLYQH